MAQPFQHVVDFMAQTFTLLEIEERQNARLFELALTTWWKALWPRMPGAPWRRELTELIADWSDRLEVLDHSLQALEAFIAEREAEMLASEPLTIRATHNDTNPSAETPVPELDARRPETTLGPRDLRQIPAFGVAVLLAESEQCLLDACKLLARDLFQSTPLSEWHAEADRIARYFAAPHLIRDALHAWVDDEIARRSIELLPVDSLYAEASSDERPALQSIEQDEILRPTVESANEDVQSMAASLLAAFQADPDAIDAFARTIAFQYHRLVHAESAVEFRIREILGSNPATLTALWELVLGDYREGAELLAQRYAIREQMEALEALYASIAAPAEANEASRDFAEIYGATLDYWHAAAWSSPKYFVDHGQGLQSIGDETLLFDAAALVKLGVTTFGRAALRLLQRNLAKEVHRVTSKTILRATVDEVARLGGQRAPDKSGRGLIGWVRAGGIVDDELRDVYTQIATSPQFARNVQVYNRIARFLGQRPSATVDEIVQALGNDVTFARVGHVRSGLFVPGEHHGATRFWIQGTPTTRFGARAGRHELTHLGAALRGQKDTILHDIAVHAATTPEMLVASGGVVMIIGGVPYVVYMVNSK